MINVKYLKCNGGGNKLLMLGKISWESLIDDFEKGRNYK